MLLSPPLESYLKFNLAFASLVLAYASISACKGLAPFTFLFPAGSQGKPSRCQLANIFPFGYKDVQGNATSQDIFMQIYLITSLGWHLLCCRLQSYFQSEFN